ncbi:MAG: UDP-N-acetylmuramate dehydrogenase [Planctomycetes bacterium]|nr:UDP-N-acetylmuramate dehydrogenase [Planctomycetota bacterium]
MTAVPKSDHVPSPELIIHPAEASARRQQVAGSLVSFYEYSSRKPRAEQPETEVVLENVSLAERTTLRVGGPARFFAEPETSEGVASAFRFAQTRSIEIKVLGGGSNLLVGDGPHDALVLSLRKMRDFHYLKSSEGKYLISADAGASLPGVVASGVKLGSTELASFAGIPGTVGGAIRMNAGSPVTGFGKFVESIVCVDRTTGEFLSISHDDAGFGYRTSNLGSLIVLGATLSIDGGSRDEARELYKDHLRRKSIAQPLTAKSAGCIFRNPEGASAGKLVEASGLKGRCRGGAEVSSKHANFIINRGGATYEDVSALIEEIREVVSRLHGVNLSLEIQVWKS